MAWIVLWLWLWLMVPPRVPVVPARAMEFPLPKVGPVVLVFALVVPLALESFDEPSRETCRRFLE